MAYVAGRHLEYRGRIILHVFQGVVEQIEDDVGEVHLIKAAFSVDGIEVYLNLAPIFLSLDLLGVDYIIDDIVDIHIREFQCRTTGIVIHRHLQHLIHLEAQTLRLLSYHSGKMLERCGGFSDRIILKHLGSK